MDEADTLGVHLHGVADIDGRVVTGLGFLDRSDLEVAVTDLDAQEQAGDFHGSHPHSPVMDFSSQQRSQTSRATVGVTLRW